MPIPSQQEQDDFRSPLDVFLKRAAVELWNRDRLREVGSSILRIMASNSNPRAARADDDVAGNLANELFVSIGCRIMLQENIWTDRRLVNGPFATVRDIIWSATTVDALHTRPDALIVTVDGYTKPAWKTDYQGRALLPTLPVTRTFLVDGHECHRTQFPIQSCVYDMLL
ncbi:uncharacterized protein N7515_002217 [Penicillium bovifimosum]|uniref:Uncharacterized protein n=1 Tax=Penicillium bovifimosum TaxID=126998 RepID=A0A9W9L7V7_9EURO|nr:uncharacterized protein N7515_002217 [Penicillium bovifimosum]KAJ5143430.1 hypothetical protein N7515_002217 [Penicillium bovifimosum]